jgi:hypothetical protein
MLHHIVKKTIVSYRYYRSRVSRCSTMLSQHAHLINEIYNALLVTIEIYPGANDMQPDNNDNRANIDLVIIINDSNNG